MNEISLNERLIALIKDMTENQQRNLLNYLESQQIGYRKYKREECSIATDYVIQNKTFQDFIENISAGGVYIIAEQPQTIGQEVSMNFTLPGYQKSVRVYGKIVRSRPKPVLCS